MSQSVHPNPQRSRLERFIYEIQSRLGIQPKWERDLLQTDDRLKAYKEFKDKGMCSTLYYLRINFLKGWMIKL
jgi:hypothetical protein